MMLSTQTNDGDHSPHMHALEHANTAIRLLEQVRSTTHEGGDFPHRTYATALNLRILLTEKHADLAELRAIEADQADDEDCVVDSKDLSDLPVGRQ